MKTRTKVILDDWFGRGFVVMLNFIARILGRILSIDHSLSKPPRRIAVCKLLGMGSIIQSTPLLQTLKSNFPNAEIVFITSKSNSVLLNSISTVDKVELIDDSGLFRIISSTFNVLSHLWKNRIDLYIDLETYSYYSTALATVSCARNRFGFYRLERNIRLGVYTHMMFFNSRSPIAQSYLQMARLAGCKNIIENLYRFQVDAELKNSMKQRINSLKPASNRYIIVNPNASDLRIERRWPPENFIDLISRIATEFPAKSILLIGAKNEKEWVDGIYSGLDDGTRKSVFNTAGTFTLEELFAVIAKSELVITNDTGPMHISFAFERPTVALFGPASPSQYGQNSHAFGIFKNIYCSPCVHDFLRPPCKGDNQCMKKITVDEVFHLCKELLLNGDNKGKILISEMSYLKNDGQTSLGILNRKENR